MDRTTVGAIHFDQIEQHGGQPGVRDEGLIQSALARPRNKWAYQPQCDLATLAAGYGFGLTKSVAFMVMYVFLGLNGYEINATEEEIVVVMRELAADVRTEADLATWLRGNIVTT